MKKRVLLIIVLFISFFLFLILFGRVLPSHATINEINKQSYSLEIDKNLFYRQTINNCGPYSVMAVKNILTEESLDPEQLSSEMKWRIYKNLTFPQGVIDLLHKYKVSTKEYVLYNKTDNEKILWIKNKIEEEKPVILLIKIHHILHYVTVLGYDENGFMLYDSMQDKLPDNPRKTICDEKCASGNRYYTNEELLTYWNNGGYKCFFRNWCIVCFKK